MKKNVAGQKIGAQVVSATDGSAFTGSVTAYVTGDAGTQAAGSVGSGACTHEGNGYHTYAPAQAETNYDLIAFTFTGTGAIPQTVQVFTSFPQTGDAFDRLGAPAGASVSADVAAVKAQTAAIEVDTAEIGAAGAGLTALATDANLAVVAGYLDTEIAAIKVVTDALPNSGALTTIQADLDNIQTRIPAALVGGNMPVDVIAISGSTAAADNLEESTEVIGTGTCTTGGSTTSVVASAVSPASAVNDQFNGRVLIFKGNTTAALAGQATTISDYDHASLTFTVVALTTAPASGDLFTIL